MYDLLQVKFCKWCLIKFLKLLESQLESGLQEHNILVEGVVQQNTTMPNPPLKFTTFLVSLYLSLSAQAVLWGGWGVSVTPPLTTQNSLGTQDKPTLNDNNWYTVSSADKLLKLTYSSVLSCPALWCRTELWYLPVPLDSLLFSSVPCYVPVCSCVVYSYLQTENLMCCSLRTGLVYPPPKS